MFMFMVNPGGRVDVVILIASVTLINEQAITSQD